MNAAKIRVFVFHEASPYNWTCGFCL